ncbi:MAG: DUF6089 family protein [Flavobacteriaceae bacterium]|nr:DUF6089 family protein [Flavobacteriaceae bacterium]
MKSLIACIIMILSYNLSNSQMHEIGLFIGGSNFIGDLGNTSYVSPNSHSLGFIYKWNVTTRYSLRASFKTAKIKGLDLQSNDLNRSNRSFGFENNISEFSSGIEFNFFDFNLHDEQVYFTPYIYTGINYFKYSLLKMNFGSKKAEEYDQELNFALPIILGIKSNLSSDVVFGFEIGFRYTFSDNLDSSNPIKDYAQDDSLKFGNINNNDWYTFTGITISYTFGRLPCYCKEK